MHMFNVGPAWLVPNYRQDSFFFLCRSDLKDKSVEWFANNCYADQFSQLNYESLQLIQVYHEPLSWLIRYF